MTTGSFSTAALLQVLQTMPSVQCYWLAFSGGLDSSVLLHAMARLRSELPASGIKVVHVNHHLHHEATAWSHQCAQAARQYGIPYQTLDIDARPRHGQSPEEAARRARYAALGRLVAAGDGLLTAHHRNDQAETVLLQLLRGAGVRGLAAMPMATRFGRGQLMRPLLAWGRSALYRYALRNKLSWIDDPSNAATCIERNFLRHRVLPVIEEHWPAADKTLSRSARHCADAAVLMDEQAGSDLMHATGGGPGTLSIRRLYKLSGERRCNLLRMWLRIRQLPPPTTLQLQQLDHDVLTAARDRMPCLRWPGAEVRRYRDDLYASRPLAFPNEHLELSWSVDTPLELPEKCGRLTAVAAVGRGLNAALCDDHRVTVRFAQRGVICQPQGYRHHRRLKNLYQEWGIPPWNRRRLPLIYIDGELAVVGNRCVCQPFHASADQAGWDVKWKIPD